jgi:hypothetical protein
MYGGKLRANPKKVDVCFTIGGIMQVVGLVLMAFNIHIATICLLLGFSVFTVPFVHALWHHRQIEKEFDEKTRAWLDSMKNTFDEAIADAGAIDGECVRID